jgi:CheY-like chemotaxis protein
VTSPKSRVLIVEDDALVAMEMEARVAALGCTVMGPAGSIASANRLLDETLPDAALLDVNICGERITPIAARLRGLGIPYALVTGYARLAFQEPELQVAKLAKPVSDVELTRTLRRLLTPPA